MSQQIISQQVGVVQQILVQEGQQVTKGTPLLQIEAMKMVSDIQAPEDMAIREIMVQAHELIEDGAALIKYDRIKIDVAVEKQSDTLDPAGIDPRILSLRERKRFLDDDRRPEAIAARDKKGRNTARKNIEKLTDRDSFIEYGGLIIAAQRGRRTEEDLIKNTPADGLVCGIGAVRSDGIEDRTHCLIMAYDFTVLAGTQGAMNHFKMDRVIAMARDRQLPVILFAEGGGGRPGGVDADTIAGLYVPTFTQFAGLSADQPSISIVEGYCFAGNAALAGAADIIIATQQSSMGMGGPAMIEGGGLGRYHPSEVGPAQVQYANGVIDVLVANEDEAIATAKKILGYAKGRSSDFKVPDQTKLQSFIPQHRKYTFDVRKMINIVLDAGSMLELRGGYASGMVTAFGRVNGYPIGIVANDCKDTAGALTAAGANKMTDFIKLCDKYGLPIVSFVDSPGLMVGPEAEKEGTVRAAGKLFVAASQFSQPFMSVVIRRGYGLGAMAMMGGSTHKSTFTVSWPSGEFGAMGIEGAVKLGYKKELMAITDEVERKKKYDQLVANLYIRGSATSMASMMEIDDVIEPQETRKWIGTVLGMTSR